AGNKVERKDVRAGGPLTSYSYEYDSVYRMAKSVKTSAQGAPSMITYSFDAVGNRTSVTGGENPGSYQLDATTPEPADFQMNQYTTTPFDSRIHDRNGNPIQTTGLGNSQRVFTYDYQNRPITATNAGTGVAVAYGYDALGRLIRKHSFGSTNSTTH